MQLKPAPWHWANPLVNVRKGLRKYIDAGYSWSPWAQTAY